MNIQAEKIQLAQMLLSTKSINVIKKVKAIFKSEEVDLWDEMPDEIRASVSIGLEESKNDIGVPHEQAMKQYKKWLKK